MRKIQKNRILAIGAILMAATINNLNLSSTVYAQQESSSTEDSSTEIQDSTEDRTKTTEATKESSAQESEGISTQEQTSKISYELQLEGETKLEKKQLRFPLNGWENIGLEIEEVYVKSGNTLKAGDPILKISSESMQKLLEYYNNQIDAAQAEVERKEVSYELEKRNAEYEREQAKQNGEMAASIRDTQLQLLQSNVSDLAKQIEQITLQINNYEKALADDTYYEEYGISDTAEAVTNSKNLMENAQRMLSEVQSKSENVDSDTLKLLQNMVDQAEHNYSLIQEQYDKLLSDYGRKVSEAQTEKNKLQDTLNSLQEEYNKKQEEDESQNVEINKEYDRAVLLSEQAEQRYNIAIEVLDEELSEAKANVEKWEKARDELYKIEDGMIYAEQDMTISSFRYHNGDEIEEEKSLLNYEDAASVLITVNVPQDEIVDWNIGDTVKIAVEGYEQLFSGTVSSMDLERAVQNNTDEIEYTATISIEQGEEQLKDGLDVTVLCGEIIEDTTSEAQETESSSEDVSQSSTESSGVDASQSSAESSGADVSQSSTESSSADASQNSTELSTEQSLSGGTQ